MEEGLSVVDVEGCAVPVAAVVEGCRVPVPAKDDESVGEAKVALPVGDCAAAQAQRARRARNLIKGSRLVAWLAPRE